MVIRKKTSKYGIMEQEEHERMIQSITQGIGGLKESLVLGCRGYFINAFSESSQRLASARKFKQVMQEIPQRFIETIAVIGMLLIAVTFLIRGGTIEGVVPILALFGVAAVKLMPSIKILVSSFHSLQYYQVAVKSVCDELLIMLRIMLRDRLTRHRAIITLPIPLYLKTFTLPIQKLKNLR